MSSSPSSLPRSPRSYDLSSDASPSLYRYQSNDSTSTTTSTLSDGPSTTPPSYAFPASAYHLPSYSQRAAYLSLHPEKQQQHHQVLTTPTGSSITLALRDQVESEIALREQRRREVLIRAKLEPLLFPAPKPFKNVVKGMFGAGKREKVAEKKRYEAEGKQLTGEELEIGKRMVEEYWAELERAA